MRPDDEAPLDLDADIGVEADAGTPRRSDVRLVGGLVHDFSMTADESAPGHIRLNLLNLGEHEVEILGLEPPGMTVRSGEEPADPLPAPPGEWVTAAQTGLIADCTLGDPGDVVRVRVRDAAGIERVVEADGLPDLIGTFDSWSAACAPPALVFPQIGVASTAVHEAATATVELPVANDSGRPLRVVGFGSVSPGLALTVPWLPIAMPANDSARVPLTWAVTDCAVALAWPDVVIDYSLERNGDQAGGSHVLTGPARAELVLLVQRVCGNAR